MASVCFSTYILNKSKIFIIVAQRSLSKFAYFFIRSFMEHGATIWDPYQRHSNISDTIQELGWPPLSQRRQEARLIIFYKIIIGLVAVPFEGVLIVRIMAQVGNTIINVGRLVMQLASMASRFPQKLLVHRTGVNLAKAQSLLNLDPLQRNASMRRCGSTKT